jgi:dTDP-glucose 4,6-dehydratase/UDP-glucose 4-epimerase
MENYRNKKILITGGVGFIGSNLARRLVNAGANVTLVDSLIPQYGGNLANILDIRDRVETNISDVRDPHSMAYLIQGKDYLFNLAGQTSHMDSMSDPFTDLDINATSQLAILEAARKYNSKVRIVFASTRQVYGRPQYLPVDEKHPVIPIDVNGINKVAGEWYHILYNKVYGIPCSALRLTNTYGPGMRVKDAKQTFLGIWVKNIEFNQSVKVFGDGLQLRDFNYVDDVVNAFLLAAQKTEAIGKVMNLGSSEVINLKELAKKMVGIAKKGTWEVIPFPPERKAIDIGDYYSDYALAKTILGWEPKVGLEEGLKKTIVYYREHGASYWE